MIFFAFPLALNGRLAEKNGSDQTSVNPVVHRNLKDKPNCFKEDVKFIYTGSEHLNLKAYTSDEYSADDHYIYKEDLKNEYKCQAYCYDESSCEWFVFASYKHSRGGYNHECYMYDKTAVLSGKYKMGDRTIAGPRTCDGEKNREVIVNEKGEEVTVWNWIERATNILDTGSGLVDAYATTQELFSGKNNKDGHNNGHDNNGHNNGHDNDKKNKKDKPRDGHDNDNDNDPRKPNTNNDSRKQNTNSGGIKKKNNRR